MRKINFITLLTILFYILFFVLILKNSLSYLDPDFGWHLKVGEEIYKTREIPNINHYNYIFPDSDNFWVDHEWLSNLLTYLSYNNLGYFGVNIIFALIFLIILIIINNFLIKNLNNNRKLILPLFIIEIFALKGIMPHSGIRIQEISWLFLLLFLIIIYYFEKNSLLNKKNNFKILFFLVPLLYLWANLHASFLLGIAILFFYLIIKIIEKIILKYKNKFTKFITKIFNFDTALKGKDLAIYFFIFLLSSLSTLLTPYGLKLFEFLYVYGNNTAYLKKISEWLPQFSYPFMYWQLLYIGITLSVWLLIVLYNKDKEKYKKILTPWNCALNLLFLILAIKSKRHFPLFFIISLPTLIYFINTDFKNLLDIGKIKDKLIDFLIKLFLITTIIVVILSISLKINFKTDAFTSFCNKYPCKAVNFLKNNQEKYTSYNLFNNYTWGGYLIYVYPEKKLFIDGRLPQKTLKDHSYIEEYFLFLYSDEEIIKKMVEEYDINLFLLSKPEKIKINFLDKLIFRLKESDFKDSALLIFLNDNSDWTKVYEDEISIIYEKNIK
jgi:hypothetical protein